MAASVEGRREEEFRDWLADFAIDCADQVRRDHSLFVEASRAGRISVSSTAPPP